MITKFPKARAFTLVELLMVAVILAILAAVIVPQFGEASTDVKMSSLKATLATVRSQLEMYKVQHKATYPTRAKFEDLMTKRTDSDGKVADDAKYGPYLLRMPVNPIDDKSTLAAKQDGTGGWAYNETTGSFQSNDSSVTEDDSETKDL